MQMQAMILDAPGPSLVQILRQVELPLPVPSWAGDSSTTPPDEMDAVIIFAPVGALLPQALRHTAKGGTAVVRRHPHERHPGISLYASEPFSGKVACAKA